jgi:hypothetical protein
VGFNMSWIFVDGINEDALYETLELAVTAEAPDPHDLGTSRVPLAGAALKSGWCAVFAKYALVMDAAVVLEHAMVSYASLWQDGRFAWQVRHDASQGGEHLEARGDFPSAFAGFRDVAADKWRAQEARSKSGKWHVDYVFDVPLDTAATIIGYHHDRAVENDFFRNLRALVPTNGDVLTKLGQPPGWWQTVGSIAYE